MIMVPGQRPEPHRLLGTLGRACWDRMLEGGYWLTAADLELVLMACETVDERGQLRLLVLRDGTRFDRQALRAVERQISMMLGALAFTPTDRARLGVGSEQAADNELDRLRARRNGPRPS